MQRISDMFGTRLTALRSEEHASRWTVDLLVAASPRPLEVCCGC